MASLLASGYESLGSDLNKRKTGPEEERKEGVVSQKLPELTLEMSDEDIVKLTTAWELSWRNSAARSEWEKNGEENEKYWLGKHYTSLKLDTSRPLVDNAIFESLETYLPQATRRNPDPIVTLDASEIESQVFSEYTNKLKRRLGDLGDKNKLRLKLKKGARHWAIYLLGVAKHGWDLDRDIPITRIIRPHRIILDPEATIDEDGYTGERIGEYRKLTASKLLAIVENEENATKAKKEIQALIKDTDAEGTEIRFIEWWTPEFFCWKLNKTILLKKKNPHWNYDEDTEEVTDDFGEVTQEASEKKGINHLPVPTMPFTFLSVFNLGDQPMDKTSLIGQNLSTQDLINKRNKQIDKNVDRQNGGMVVSLERSGLTQAQAKGVSESLRKGGVIAIPTGSPRDAIDDYAPTSLPADVYNNLADMRIRLKDVFGTRGSTPSGIESEKTVRGKIINRGLDTDRIGGGVSEYLEQFADDIYNWWVQLLYVYDSGFQFIEGGRPPKVVVSVKEGSLLPKDSTTLANQAIELASANKMSTVDLYKKLEYANPEELAANNWLEQNAPHLLFKDNPLVQEAIQAQVQAAAAQAQTEQQTKQQDNQQEIQKEQAKAQVKQQAKPTSRSLLKQVPQNAA